MAGTSPRRSSRARTTQSTSNNSSSASSTSGRSERNTRSFNKTGSPQKSTGTSLSSEPPDDAVPESTLTTRRRTRALDDERDRLAKAESVEMAIDDIQEDDEAIRCVCGFDDYPGPPPFDPDAKHGKDAFDNEPISASDMTDDLAGFYLQCDSCNVWQHGACFGITEESSTPDNWYCELCRPDLHKVSTASNGQRYSTYLPLRRSSGSTSRAGSLVKDDTRSPKETTAKNGRPSSAVQTSKRRSTMNSRYDEEEELRRAIEASKEDALPEHPEPTSRRAKRGRSDSEEKSENIKRQRTDSRSLSPPAEKDLSSPEESTETTNTRNSTSSKKSRNASHRNQREKIEREERERQRAEAAKKRNGRAERRRAEDSPPEDIPLAARTPATKPVETPLSLPPAPVEPPLSRPSPDTPPAAHPSVNSSHKKGGRPTHKKGKGRNQYTKDRDSQDHEDSPGRPQSKEAHKAIDENGHSSSNHKSGENGKQFGHKQTKHVLPKISIHDMNRRANWIMDFISRTQMELAGEEYTQRHPTRRSGDAVTNHLLLPPSCDDAPNPAPEANGAAKENREFKELSSMEMMDFLAREIIQWQQEHCPELKT